MKDVVNVAPGNFGKAWHKYISGINILNADHAAVHHLVEDTVGCPWLLKGITEATPLHNQDLRF